MQYSVEAPEPENQGPGNPWLEATALQVSWLEAAAFVFKAPIHCSHTWTIGLRSTSRAKSSTFSVEGTWLAKGSAGLWIPAEAQDLAAATGT